MNEFVARLQNFHYMWWLNITWYYQAADQTNSSASLYRQKVSSLFEYLSFTGVVHQ